MRILIGILFFSYLSSASAVIRYCSAARDDVVLAIAASSNGDTIIVSPGTNTWTSPVTLSKAITIQGAGIGDSRTYILNGSGDIDLACFSITVNSSTIITRITGMCFDGQWYGRGITFVATPQKKIRIDNCHFFNCRSRSIYCISTGQACIDNCYFDNCSKAFGDVYGSSEEGAGDNSWNRARSVGGIDTVCIEDCVARYNVIAPWPGGNVGATSSSGLGGRRILRHCIWTNTDSDLSFFPVIDAHGNQQRVDFQVNQTGSWTDPDGPNTVIEGGVGYNPDGPDGPHRGSLNNEIYANTFVSVIGSSQRFTDLRGGTALVYSNTFISGNSWTLRMREEDKPSEGNFASSYPGMDMHHIWAWSNTWNGALHVIPTAENDEDWLFIQHNVNLFTNPPSTWTYTQLVYPHPFRTGETPVNPGYFNLSYSTTTVAENAGQVQLVIRRLSGNWGEAIVNFTTTDGTATSGVDYISTNGVVSWVDGNDASAFIDIAILDDAVIQEDHTFTFSITSGSTNTFLGTPSTATITISPDNDSPDPGGTGVPVQILSGKIRTTGKVVIE